MGDKINIGERFNPYKQFTGAFIPNWLLERNEVSSNAKLVYARLCEFAGPNGRCYPLRATLANECGISISSVDRALRELKRYRLIESERQGLDRPNRYYFLIHPWFLDSMNIRKKADPELSNMISQSCQHQQIEVESFK